MRKIGGAIAVVLTCVSMAACGSSGWASQGRNSDLNSAYVDCSKIDPSISWDFHTLTVTEPASDASGLQCVITDLKISDGIAQRMDATKAMDGQQSATENGLDIGWSISVDASGNQQVFAQFSSTS